MMFQSIFYFSLFLCLIFRFVCCSVFCGLSTVILYCLILVLVCRINVLIIIIIFFLTPVLNSRGMKKLRYAIQKSTKIKLEWTLLLLLLLLHCLHVSVFRALTLLTGQQEGHPACKKTKWWVAGMIICLERGADLHMAQLMLLPLTVSCFSKIQTGLSFWCRLTWVDLKKGR